MHHQYQKLIFTQKPPTNVAPYGSVHDYWWEVSNHTLDIEGKVFGWYHLPYAKSHYESQGIGPDGQPYTYVHGDWIYSDAIQIADKDIDYSQYHNVIVVFCENDQWCSPQTSRNPIRIDNNDGSPITYSILVNGLQNDLGHIAGIGSFAHEMGHSYGLFDCYVLNAPDNQSNVGIWTLMGFGCRLGSNGVGGDCTCPAELSPWEKATLGFITPIRIASSTISLPIQPIENLNTAYQILDNPNGYDFITNGAASQGELFLIEYRRNDTKFGRGLPGQGLLIWHIDESKPFNGDATDPEIKLIDLEEANNIEDPALEYRSTVPWSSANTAGFTPYSSPNSNLNNGVPSGLSVTGISAIPSDTNAPMTATIGFPPSGYSSVKTHDIPGSSDGVLTDYQVHFVVHNTTGTDTDKDIYLNGGSQSWPNDIRFTNSNNELLSYWIESNDTNTATIWVKVDNIPASPGSATINIYYGRPNDSGESNGDATFILFDDFNDNSLNPSKWVKVLGDPSADVYEQNHELELMSGTGTYSRPFLRTAKSYSGDFVVDVSAKYLGDNGIIVATDWDGTLVGHWMGPNNGYECYYDSWDNPTFWQISRDVDNVGTSLGTYYYSQDNNFHAISVTQKPQIALQVDGTLTTGASDTTYTSGYVGLGGREGQNSIRTIYDNFRIRKYTAHPPAQNAWMTVNQSYNLTNEAPKQTYDSPTTMNNTTTSNATAKNTTVN